MRDQRWIGARMASKMAGTLRNTPRANHLGGNGAGAEKQHLAKSRDHGVGEHGGTVLACRQGHCVALSTVAMNGVSHGVVLGATDNGPRSAVPTEEGSISVSSPLSKVSGEVHLNGTCGPDLRLRPDRSLPLLPAGNVYCYDVEISENNKEANIPKKHKYRCISTKVNRLAIEQLGKKVPPRLPQLRAGIRWPKEPVHASGAQVSTGSTPFPQEVLKAIDIVLLHGPSIRLTPIGRSFFKPPFPNQADSLGAVSKCGSATTPVSLPGPVEGHAERGHVSHPRYASRSR
ncbi:hypothetical protein MRX96_006926 [Rhipicephalus microplus]